MGSVGSLVGFRRSATLAALLIAGLALLVFAPAGAGAKTKLKVKVASSSQTQVLNQGALKVSYDAKGLNSLSATAKATPDGGSAVNFAAKASKNNPKSGTLSLPLTDDGTAAVEDCVSLTVNVSAKGKPKKSAKAKAVLAEDDPECAKPVKEFDTDSSNSYPTGIDVGPDDALWFAHTGAGMNTVGRLTTDGEYSNFHVPVPAGTPSGGSGGHFVNDVVNGPEGGLWVTPSTDGLLASDTTVLRRIDPATGDVTDEIDLGVNVGVGSKIAVGADGNLWLTSSSGFGSPGLIRVSPAGDVTQFPLSDPDHPEISVTPYGIAAAGDGTIWFTTPDPNNATPPAAIGRFDPATEETTLFPLANPDELMGYMATDAAGRIWFTTPKGNTIGRIDPEAPAPQVVEFQIPTPDSKPVGITFAEDGSLWFAESNSDNIGRYDPASGLFTEYPLETQGTMPFDIVQGPDGKIYFTEMGLGKIGQLDPNKAPVGDPNPTDGTARPPFGDQHRCPDGFLCQQQVNLEGSTFDIGTALHQVLPPETLRLTAGVNIGGGPLEPPKSGPMLESQPLDTTVAGQEAVTRVGLAGPPVLVSLLPLHVTVPIDLYVSQPGNPAGGCVIGPVTQELLGVPDDDGDMGTVLSGDAVMIEAGISSDAALLGTGTFADDVFVVPEARGCGALTDIINSVLMLPSDSGENHIRLPFTQLLTVPDVF